MEISELKQMWSTLDERLKKQEILETNVLQNILHNRSNDVLDKLFKYELKGMIGIPLVFIFYLPLFRVLSVLIISPKDDYISKIISESYNYGFSPLWIAVYLLSILAFAWQGYKVYLLSRINFDRALDFNILVVYKYKINTQREKIFTLLVMFLLFCLIIATTLSLGIEQVLIIAGVFILVIFITWIRYKRNIEPKIQDITKNLKELKELEEEE